MKYSLFILGCGCLVAVLILTFADTTRWDQVLWWVAMIGCIVGFGLFECICRLERIEKKLEADDE